MKIPRLWLVSLLFLAALLALAAPLRAQAFSLELMTGSAYNFPTPLTVHQAGYPDISLTADYDTKPFGPYTPYYAWRASLWDKSEAWEIEQVHHRLFLTDPPPEIQNFSIHFGYNFFLFGHAWKRGDFIFHADAGVLITNPANTVRGQVLHTGGTGIFRRRLRLFGVRRPIGRQQGFLFLEKFLFDIGRGIDGRARDQGARGRRLGGRAQLIPTWPFGPGL